MKMGRRFALVGLTILLSSIIFGSVGIQAIKPVRTELTFEYHWTSYEAAKKEWTTDDGILHTLQTPHYGEVTAGDLVGDVYYCGNLILDLNTYSGKGGGKFEFEGEYNGEAVGFSGKMIFEIDSLVLTGTLNCPGSGAFKNTLIKGTVYTVLFVLPVTYVTIVLWT